MLELFKLIELIYPLREESPQIYPTAVKRKYE